MPAELGARVDQVLAVVERQKQLAWPERRGERLQQRPRRFFPDADHRRHPRDDEVGLPQVGQLNEPDAIGELIRRLGQDPHSQPGLPDTPGSAERERAGLAYHPEQLGELFLAADETIRRLGQIGQNLHYLVRLLDDSRQQAMSLPERANGIRKPDCSGISLGPANRICP